MFDGKDEANWGRRCIIPRPYNVQGVENRMDALIKQRKRARDVDDCMYSMRIAVGIHAISDYITALIDSIGVGISDKRCIDVMKLHKIEWGVSENDLKQIQELSKRWADLSRPYTVPSGEARRFEANDITVVLLNLAGEAIVGGSRVMASLMPLPAGATAGPGALSEEEKKKKLMRPRRARITDVLNIISQRKHDEREAVMMFADVMNKSGMYDKIDSYATDDAFIKDVLELIKKKAAEVTADSVQQNKWADTEKFVSNALTLMLTQVQKQKDIYEFITEKCTEVCNKLK
jgi:hypothetical protein